MKLPHYNDWSNWPIYMCISQHDTISILDNIPLTLWCWEMTSWLTVWCWENWTSPKVISQKHANL